MEDDYIFVADGQVVGSFTFQGAVPMVELNLTTGIATHEGTSPAEAALAYRDAEFPSATTYIRLGGRN